MWHSPVALSSRCPPTTRLAVVCAIPEEYMEAHQVVAWRGSGSTSSSDIGDL
jgi:hypothetical protein